MELDDPALSAMVLGERVVYNRVIVSRFGGESTMQVLGTVVGFLLSLPLAEGVEPAGTPKRLSVSRADIALAYQRFERAFLDHRPERQGLVDANLVFEAVTKSFFGMNFPAAIAQLNAKAIELEQHRPAQEEEKWLASLKVTVDPPIIVNSSTAKISLRPMYATEAKLPGEVTVILSSGAETRELGVAIGTDGSGEGELESKEGLWQGTWNVSVGLPGGMKLKTGRTLQGVPRDLDSLREEHSARLAKIMPTTAAMKGAWETCRARNQHLKMKPGEALSTEFLTDYNQLAPEIAREVSQLEQGKDPYAGRRGDYWRVVVRGTTKIPMRVYVPEKLDLSQPVPVVVALHGAGGDENMFMDAYGQGELQRQADRVGFVAVSPATFFFTSRSDMLEPLIEDLGYCYAVDRKRIYVLGHSMGGGATTRLAADQASLIRAASCLAGFRGFPPGAKVPPTYVVAAELDEIIPAAGIESAARRGIEEGLPIKFELVPQYGHTLVVEAKLGDVIDWMWQQ